MPEFATPEDYSLEAEQSFAEDELFAIDWSVQAEGCELMYQQTGDTDWELMRVEAKAKADRQQQIVSTAEALIQQLR